MHIIAKYFALTEIQVRRFAMLGPLYKAWNEKINVISRKDIDNLYLHHVLHSLSIGMIIKFLPGTIVIDAGTGGGFPGIPLAILFPEVRFILADSIQKKIRVVEAITGELGLNNCETRNLRLEELKDKGDFVVSRAVTELPVLLKWTKKNLIPGGKHLLKNGLLALKGGELTDEIKTINDRAVIFNLVDYFAEPFFETKKLVYISADPI